MRLALAFLGFFALFTPKDRIEKRIDDLAKNEIRLGTAVQGWNYFKLQSENTNITHWYYEIPGPGKDAPVLILLHGLILDGRNFLNYASLSNRWRLISYEWPQSSSAYKGSIDDCPELLKDFLKLKNIKKFDLAGVSFGGINAIRFAAHPDDFKIDHLILISTLVNGSDKKSRRDNAYRERWVDRRSDLRVFRVMEPLTRYGVRKAEEDTGNGLKEIIVIKHPAFYRQVLQAVGGYDAREDAAACSSYKTLHIHGEDDTTVPMETAATIEKYIRGVKRVTITNAGHALSFNHAEKVKEEILKFIQ